MVSELGGYDLVSMFPGADHEDIIVTTRRNQLAFLSTSDKDLEKMNEEQSIDVLENTIGQSFVLDENENWSRQCILYFPRMEFGLTLDRG